MKILRVYLLLVSVLFLLIGCRNESTDFQATIVDDISGKPVPARVYVSSPDGVRIELDGDHKHVDYLSKTWCYSNGKFSITSAPGDVIVEIRKGLENRPIKDTLSLTKNKEALFRIKRWVDMIKEGYVSGDVHGHYELLNGTEFMREVLLQMKAEDLSVLTILSNEGNSVTPHFTGSPDTMSTTEHKIYVGQEVRDWQMGHLTLIGLSKLVEGYPQVGGVLEHMKQPHWLMHHAMRDAHKQGGLVIWSHYSNLPGAESPIAIALGQIDALELMTFNDPTDLPSHWSPWNNSGMSQAEFTIMRGMDLYYQYLNAGFVLPIVAGTDKMKDDIPVGSNRYYAAFKGTDRYKAWTNGIEAGNGFITNGPMLDFRVDDSKAGDSINFSGTRRVKAHILARSILPFTTLEIVRNGDVVGHKTIFVKDNPPLNGVYTMELDTVVELTKSSWLAGRVADDPDNRSRILPRGLSVFAHTNPIYFYQKNSRVREKASIDYLIRYTEGVIHWLERKPPFANPEDHKEALRLANDALKVYRSL